MAFITGAGRGIGAAVAVALARRGIVPILAVRDPERAAEAMAAVSACGVEAHAVQCDVEDHASVARAVQECVRVTGRLDIVVNNAGRIEPIGKLAEVEPHAWRGALAVNLFGPFAVLHAAIPHLLRSASAAIVNISSGAAHTPREGWSAYCSTKAGLAMLTRSVALEYPGIHSYGFQPGVVDTDMQVTIRASGVNEISRIPRQQLAAPSRPAAAVAWLCDERPADRVGHDLAVGDALFEHLMKTST